LSQTGEFQEAPAHLALELKPDQKQLSDQGGLARFIHEGAEERLSTLCFGGEEGNEGAERRRKEPRRVIFR
jgi:hypothetical protein